MPIFQVKAHALQETGTDVSFDLDHGYLYVDNLETSSGYEGVALSDKRDEDEELEEHIFD